VTSTHSEDHHSQSEYVGRLTSILLSLVNLGGQVGWSAPGLRHEARTLVALDVSLEAKIAKSDLPIKIDQNVLKLNIVVRHRLRMTVVERRQYLSGEMADHTLGKHSTLNQGEEFSRGYELADQGGHWELPTIPASCCGVLESFYWLNQEGVLQVDKGLKLVLVGAKPAVELLGVRLIKDFDSTRRAVICGGFEHTAASTLTKLLGAGVAADANRQLHYFR